MGTLQQNFAVRRDIVHAVKSRPRELKTLLRITQQVEEVRSEISFEPVPVTIEFTENKNIYGL